MILLSADVCLIVATLKPSSFLVFREDWQRLLMVNQLVSSGCNIATFVNHKRKETPVENEFNMEEYIMLSLVFHTDF